jgi:hypothetical protein
MLTRSPIEANANPHDRNETNDLHDTKAATNCGDTTILTSLA